MAVCVARPGLLVLVGLSACSFRLGYDLEVDAAGAAVDATVDDAAADATLTDASPADAPVAAQTLSFGDRPGSDVAGAIDDTCVDSDFATDNYGADTDLFVRHRSGQDIHGLYRFDLGALPAGAQVQAATLELWTEQNVLAGGSIRLYRVLEAWDEGAGSQTPGAASWNERQPGVPWSAAGGLPPSSEASFVAELSGLAPTSPHTVILPATLVQSWVDDPTSNFGLLAALANSSDDVIFEGSESPRSERRPLLIVSFIVP